MADRAPPDEPVIISLTPDELGEIRLWFHVYRSAIRAGGRCDVERREMTPAMLSAALKLNEAARRMDGPDADSIEAEIAGAARRLAADILELARAEVAGRVDEIPEPPIDLVHYDAAGVDPPHATPRGPRVEP